MTDLPVHIDEAVQAMRTVYCTIEPKEGGGWYATTTSCAEMLLAIPSSALAALSGLPTTITELADRMDEPDARYTGHDVARILRDLL